MNKLTDLIVYNARIFATAAHAAVGQRRKYTGEPYIAHPKAVVELVESVPHTPEMLAAAWLHDVVEDTQVSMVDIRSMFGVKVQVMVWELTDPSKLSDGNREARKTIDRLHTGRASAEAKTIKLADLIDNTSSIVQHDPDFAKTYLKEKRALLEVLQEGDPVLLAKAKETLIAGWEALA